MGIDTDNIERLHSDMEELFRKQEVHIFGKEVFDEIERTKREYPDFQRKVKIVTCPYCHFDHGISNSPDNPDVMESDWVDEMTVKFHETIGVDNRKIVGQYEAHKLIYDIKTDQYRTEKSW